MYLEEGVLLRWSIVAWAVIVAASACQGAEPFASTSGLSAIARRFDELKPEATWKLGGTADWVEIAAHAVWVGVGGPNRIARIDPVTNRVAATVDLPGQACAGLTSGFGRLWVPLCGIVGAPNALAEVDLATASLIRVLPISPAAEEGGIAASADSLWMVTDTQGSLARIDPRTGRPRAAIHLRPGSYNPVYADGVVWVTCIEANLVTAVDAGSGAILGEIPTGPRPRFLTAGAGSIWTLNQGDGSLTRIDRLSRRVVASVALGVPGPGGDIAFGARQIWVTVAKTPLSAVDAMTNTPRRQWTGPGGDSLRVAFGSIWITDYHAGILTRVRLSETQRP